MGLLEEHKRPRKVAVFSFCHGEGSGAERVLEHLLEAASFSVREKLLVVAPKESGILLKGQQLGYETLVWPSRSRSAFLQDLPAALSIVSRLRRTFPDHLHAWHSRCFEIVALLAKQLNLPLTGTLHDHPRDLGARRSRHFLMRWGANRMKALVCVSHALSQACAAEGWEVPIRTIPNGLPDIPWSEPTAGSLPLRIAFLGGFDMLKGAQMVFDLARRMSRDTFHWNIYGTQPTESIPQTFESGCGQENVLLKGRRPPAEICEENDVIFHPSPRFDCYPTVLLEAARGGLPSVATDVGGSREIVVHMETGFLFPVGHPEKAEAYLDQLSHSPDLWLEMARNARLRFEQHLGVGAMLDGYLDFWNLHQRPHSPQQ